MIDDKIDALRPSFAGLGRVVVAFSGGADSAFLAAVAHQVLGDDAHAVTAVSPSLAGDEEADCRALADEWGLRWTPVVTHEMERAAYRINDTDRCYHCKAELMDVVGPIAAASGATVVLGVNLDDLGDHRPGQRAADQRGAVFPLVTAGFTKADVRAASLALGLRTWDKPAAACLASRVPYGTEVTVASAQSGRSRRGRAETTRIRRASSSPLRRHGTDRSAGRAPRRRDRVSRRRRRRDKGAGYTYVTLDLEGFRSGNLNECALLPRTGLEDMKLSMMINYAGGFKEAVQRVGELEKAGLDQVWVAEAYSYDAISQIGLLWLRRPSGSRSAPASSTCTRARQRSSR